MSDEYDEALNRGADPPTPITAETRDAGRQEDGRYLPGTSGNPKGRPKLPQNYKDAIEKLGPRALQALSDIIEDSEHPRHEQAAEYVMNRWKGSPTQRAEFSGPGGGPIETRDRQMTREEMRREIERLESGGDEPGDGE